MEGSTLDLASVGGVAAPAVGVVLAQHLRHMAVLVFDTAGAADEVGTLQTALRAVGVQALILGNRHLQKILRLDPQVAAESDLMGTLRGIGGVILHGEGLALSFRIVGDRELHRVQHRHGALGRGVEILPQAMLQKAVLHGVGGLSHADALAEIADGAGSIAPAAQAA